MAICLSKVTLISKRARPKNRMQMLIHHQRIPDERTRGDLGEVFVSKMCFRNTGCFRKCFRKIVSHSGLIV